MTLAYFPDMTAATTQPDQADRAPATTLPPVQSLGPWPWIPSASTYLAIADPAPKTALERWRALRGKYPARDLDPAAAQDLLGEVRELAQLRRRATSAILDVSE